MGVLVLWVLMFSLHEKVWFCVLMFGNFVKFIIFLFFVLMLNQSGVFRFWFLNKALAMIGF